MLEETTGEGKEMREGEERWGGRIRRKRIGEEGKEGGEEEKQREGSRED